MYSGDILAILVTFAEAIIEEGKPVYPGKNLSEQRQEPTRNSIHV